MKKHHQLLSLVAMLALLMAGDVFSAWTVPGQLPPNGNVDAPINVGTTDQIKVGGLGIGGLDVAGGAIVRGTSVTTDVDFTVMGKVGAREYCDETGANCSTTVGGGGGTWGTWTAVSRSPRTWYQNNATTGRAIHYQTAYGANWVYVSPTGRSADWVPVASPDGDSGEWGPGFFIVPPGHYYYFNNSTAFRQSVSELQLPF